MEELVQHGVLDARSILRLIESPEPLLEGYLDLDLQLQPNGVDLTVSEVRQLTSAGEVSAGAEPASVSDSRLLSFDDSGVIHLPRGAFLVQLNEVVRLPRHITALARPRSSLLRSGASVHTGVWDAGYRGRSQILLTVHNPLGYRVARGARVVQMVFLGLSRSTDGYSGRYQGENLP